MGGIDKQVIDAKFDELNDAMKACDLAKAWYGKHLPDVDLDTLVAAYQQTCASAQNAAQRANITRCETLLGSVLGRKWTKNN